MTDAFVAEPPTEATRCSACDCEAFVGAVSAAYCGTCGHSRSEHGRTSCASCGADLADNVSFCTGCGAPVTRAWLRAPSGFGEQLGTTIGRTVGRTAATAVATAAEPVYAKVWQERPNLPRWHKALGFVSWPAAVLTPHGLVVIAASFLTMVVLGRHNPYQWLVWATKVLNFLLIATLIAGAILLIVIYAADSSEAYARLSLLV